MWEILNNKKKAIVWAIIIVIVPAFCFFGVSSMLMRYNSNPVAGIVGGEKIKLEEYSKYQEAVVVMARLIYRDNFARIRNERDINKLVWDSILMTKEAEKLGVEVSDDELMRFIKTIPYFVTNKKFDYGKYSFMLKEQLRITPVAFERILKDFMVLEKLKRIIADTVTVSEEEARIEYVANNKKRRSYFVTVKIDDYKNTENITDQMVSDYYDEFKASFEKPAQVKLNYVFQDWMSLQKSIDITEDELKSLYEQNKESYKRDGKILSFEDVRSRIERNLKYVKAVDKAQSDIGDVYNLLEEGKSLTEAAELKGFVVKETEYLGKGETIATVGISSELTTAPFYMEDGQYTIPVKTANGFALAVRVAGKNAYIPAVNEITAEIKDKIASEKASDIAKEAAEKQAKDVSQLMKAQNLTFADACAKLEISYDETDYFSTKEPIDKVFNFRLFRDKTFALDFNKVSKVFLDKDAYIYLTPVAEKYPDAEDFDKRKKMVVAQYTSKRKHKMVQDWLLDLYSKYDLQDNTDKLKAKNK